MSARVVRLVPGLAMADLRHEWILTLCLVIAVAAVVAPLLILPGLKHGTVQDKLFLPGLKKLAFLRDSGFFGRMLSVRGAERVVWVDAKYKAHLELLSRRGWSGLSDEVRADHRADLHQALAYASLADAPQVDTLLVYPDVGAEDRFPATVATVTSGRRRVRLVLAAVPFGYRNPEHKERCLRSFREVLAA